MSKSMIGAFALAQVASLTADTNKDRLRFTIAGCKDGHLYSHNGTDFGLYDEDAKDIVFIPESDLELSRITGAKLEGIAKKMRAFFGTETPEEVAVAETEEVAKTEEVDTEAVEKATKKAIKKGDLKKAQKLIDKLGGHKKLQKKLDAKMSESEG